MELPARYAVRDYLKQRLVMQERISEESLGGVFNEFHHAYARHHIDSETLRSFAANYAGFLRDTGCFKIEEEYVAATRVLPHRECASVTAYSVDPVALGFGWGGDQSNPYIQNGALVRFHEAEFRRKKATIGQAYGGVVLTQHVLERVYERTEVDWKQLPDLIHGELELLLQALAVSWIGNLWMTELVEGTGGDLCTAVPYANGLMIAKIKTVFGSFEDADFGFRGQIPSGKIETPYLNKDWIIMDLQSGEMLRGDNRPVLTICGTTYFCLTDLDDRELDYFHAFSALLTDIGDELLSVIAYYRFAPTMAHQRHPDLDLSKRYGKQVSRLKSLLHEGWLKTKAMSPICFLLPFDHKMPVSPKH